MDLVKYLYFVVKGDSIPDATNYQSAITNYSPFGKGNNGLTNIFDESITYPYSAVYDVNQGEKSWFLTNTYYNVVVNHETDLILVSDDEKQSQNIFHVNSPILTKLLPWNTRNYNRFDKVNQTVIMPCNVPTSMAQLKTNAPTIIKLIILAYIINYFAKKYNYY